MNRPSATLISTTRLAEAPLDSASVPDGGAGAVEGAVGRSRRARDASVLRVHGLLHDLRRRLILALPAAPRRRSPGDGASPFIADDSYTAPLRWVLGGRGYAVHGWRQGTNLSRTAKIVNGLPHRLLELHERHGAKVSLVGHSGGGNWARDLAREYPHAVRQVITLGAPFRLRPGDATQADQLARDAVA